MIDILINGKVVKRVATIQSAIDFRKHYREEHPSTQIIGRFSDETGDPDYNEYRREQQEHLYK